MNSDIHSSIYPPPRDLRCLPRVLWVLVMRLDTWWASATVIREINLIRGYCSGRRPRWRSRFSQVAQIKATKRLAAAQEEANRIAKLQAGRPSPFQAAPAAASPRTNFFTPQHAVVHFSGCAVACA